LEEGSAHDGASQKTVWYKTKYIQYFALLNCITQRYFSPWAYRSHCEMRQCKERILSDFAGRCWMFIL